MSKPTAVQWLIKELKDLGYYTYNLEKLCEQAKQMEKDEIVEAVYDSMGTSFDPSVGRAELYYKEKYENGYK